MKLLFLVLLIVLFPSFFCVASGSDEELFTFVKNNDTSGVQQALNSNANINARDVNNETPLILAIRQRNIDISRILIDRGADLNVKTKDGYSLLLLAISREYLGTVQLLVEKGVDINAKENITETDGEPALVFASGMGSEPRNNKIVDFLIERGAKVKAKSKNGYTALMHKAFQRNLEKVKLLLEKGAEVNSKNKYGGTALTGALSARDFEERIYPVVELLIKNGAEINLRDDGETPLILAAKNGYERCIRLLAEKGAKLNESNNQHETALLLACKKGWLSSLRALLVYGASPNISDCDGITPLMYAIHNYHMNNERKKFVSILVSYKADIYAKDKTGKSVMDRVKENNVPLEVLTAPAQ